MRSVPLLLAVVLGLLAVVLGLLAGCGDAPPPLSVKETPLRLATGKRRFVTLDVDREVLEGALKVRISGLPEAVDVPAARIPGDASKTELVFHVVEPVLAGTTATARIEVSGDEDVHEVLELPVVFEMPGGTADASFGLGGALNTEAQGNLGVCALAAAADGTVVVARAHATEYVLEWRDGSGALLRTASVLSGPVAVRGLDDLEPYRCGLAVDATGRTWFAGSSAAPGTTTRDVAVVRFLPDSAVDVSFGVEGTARLAQVTQGGAASVSLEACALELLERGNLLVMGCAPGMNVIARLDASGRLDDAFGDSGRVSVGAGRLSRLLLLPGGRILSITTRFSARYQLLRPVVQAWLASGAPDTGYGEGSEFVLPPGDVNLWTWTGSFVTGAALEPDGSVVLAVASQLLREDPRHDQLARLVRLTPHGQLDTSWGQQGVRVFSPGDGVPLLPSLFPVLGRLEDGRLASALWMNWDRRRVLVLFTLQPDGSLHPASRDSHHYAAMSRLAWSGPDDARSGSMQLPRWMVLLPDGRALVASDLISREGPSGPPTVDQHLARFFL